MELFTSKTLVRMILLGLSLLFLLVLINAIKRVLW